jgi:hypothetical protein
MVAKMLESRGATLAFDAAHNPYVELEPENTVSVAGAAGHRSDHD